MTMVSIETVKETEQLTKERGQIVAATRTTVARLGLKSDYPTCRGYPRGPEGGA